MKVSEKLYELRKEANLSQEEVANKLNVSRQTVSKWETDQSTPDFDKIAPLCELYQISADDLLNLGTKENNKGPKEDKKNGKNKKALVITLSTSLYFLAVIYVIMASEVWLFGDALIACGFLGICMFASALLIYYFVSHPNEEKIEKKKLKEKEEPKNKIYDLVISIVSIITVIVYLTISFKTMAWHITWIIWIIFALIVEIIKLVFQILGGKNDR